MAATASKANKAGRLPRKGRGDLAKEKRSKNGTELMAKHEEVVKLTTTQTFSVVISRGASIETKGMGTLKVERQAERARCGPSTAPEPVAKASKRMKGEAAKHLNDRKVKKPHDAPQKRKAEGYVDGDGSTRGRKSHNPAPKIKGSKCTKGETAVKRTYKMQAHDSSVETKGHRMLAEKESAKGATKKQGGQSLTSAPSLKSCKCTKEMKKKDVRSKSLEQQKAEKCTKGAESRRGVHSYRHSLTSVPCRAEGSEVMKREKVAKRKNRTTPPSTSVPTSSAMTPRAKGARSRQQRPSLNPGPAILHLSPITNCTSGSEERTTTENVLHNAAMKTKGPRGEGRVKGARRGQSRQHLSSVTGMDSRPLTDCAYYMQGSDQDCAKGEKVHQCICAQQCISIYIVPYYI